MFVLSTRTRPFFAHSLSLAVLSLTVTVTAAAQGFDPGPEAGATTAPVLDAATRTVHIASTGGDDTALIMEAIAVCSSARVGCTVTFSPGIYTVRGLEIVHVTGMLAVVGSDLKLTGHFTSVAPLRFVSVYLQSDHGGRYPAITGFTF